MLDPAPALGLTGVVFAGDLFNVFVFLEVTTLSTCALIAIAEGKALVFAFRYLILASIGATFYLLGVTFVYGATGTLNMADLAQRLPALAGSHAMHHRPGVHVSRPGDQDGADAVPRLAARCLHLAPDAVAPLCLALVTKVSLLAWIRIMYRVARCGPGAELAAGVAHLLDDRRGRPPSSGAFLALIQRDVKRMFAYGGVSHIGLIMLGAGLGNETGLAGSLFYLVNDAVMQATLFVLAGIAATHYGVRTIEQLGHAAEPGALAGRRADRRGAVDDRHSADRRVLRQVVHRAGRHPGRRSTRPLPP